MEGESHGILLLLLISPTVFVLFNNSSDGIFLECFKIAKIIPIFKFGDSNSTPNYRPIVMLPCQKYFRN